MAGSLGENVRNAARRQKWRAARCQSAPRESVHSMPRICFVFFLVIFPAWAQLQGVIDLHVHSSPDSRPRTLTAIEVAQIARRHGVRALLLKDHYTQTASMAFLVGQVVPGIEVYGAIALNRAVGGVNPAAVENMVKITGHLGRLVFMPTFDARQVPVSNQGVLLPDVLEILDIVARERLAIATGHLTADDSLLLLREARSRGIERMIVTHPLGSMTMEQMKEAARLGAFIEQTYNSTLSRPQRIDDIVAAVRGVGPEHTILTSDLGLAGTPVHTDGLLTFFQQLRERGLTNDEIDRMSKQNPARLLGID